MEITIDSLRPEALQALREVMSTQQSENFGLSQFWYTDECADSLAAALRSVVSGRIAVMSCPSLHAALRRRDPDDASVLFEYDRRFDAVFFDYRADPTDLPEGGFDFVVIDPPYVSHACLTAFWAFVERLSTTPDVLVFSSLLNRDWLSDRVRLTNFHLRFTSKLATPLRAFTNLPALADALDGFAPPVDDAP